MCVLHGKLVFPIKWGYKGAQNGALSVENFWVCSRPCFSDLVSQKFNILFSNVLQKLYYSDLALKGIFKKNGPTPDSFSLFLYFSNNFNRKNLYASMALKLKLSDKKGGTHWPLSWPNDENKLIVVKLTNCTFYYNYLRIKWAISLNLSLKNKNI